MMQHGWRGGPPMRGGGMRGRGGGGFNQGGGFRGRGGGHPPRGDRSRSPLRGKVSLGEPSDWEMKTNVILDYYNSDLNLNIDNSGVSATILCKDGFAFMWGGARATYGVKSPIGKDGYPTHVCFEVRIGEKLPVSHLPPEEANPHVLRIGWSTDDTSFALGEEPRSWGYGGTGKKSVNCKFENYGTQFSSGDVVASFIEFEANGFIHISYSINGRSHGEAFKFHTRDVGERALFPHIYTKNLPFEVNFGQQEKPWAQIPENPSWQFIEKVPVEKRIRGLCPPQKIEDCEILMMCGLPGAGKTYWAEKHVINTPEKRFTVLGTNNILEKMKVMGLPRKRNYRGRWDVLIELSTKCLNKLFEIASRRKRNYILDQTNVYLSAQRRKMRPFESFHRKAVVVVPTDEEFKRRIVQRTKDEGKEVPESAVSEMKANFTVPAENDLFEEIIFTELDRQATEELVKQYNQDGRKRSGGFSAPPSSAISNASDDSSGAAKFRPDRNYGRSSGGAGPSTQNEFSSVSSFGRPSDNESGSRGGRGGSRGGFRGGFNADNKPDGSRGFDSVFRAGGSGGGRGGMDQDRSRRGAFENRRGGFQRDGGNRFDADSFGSGRGGFTGQRQGGFSGGDQAGDGFQSESRFQGGDFHDRKRGLDQSQGGQPGFGRDDRPGFGGRSRSGFEQSDSSNQQGDMYRQDQSDPGSSYGGRGGFSDRGHFAGGRGSYSGQSGESGSGYGDRREGGFGGDRGGRFGERGRGGGDRGGRGRGGFGDRGRGGYGDRGRGGFGGSRDFNQGYGDQRGGPVGYGDRSSSGFGDTSGRSDYDGGYGDRGNERHSGYGGSDVSAGFGGDRSGGYSGERPGGYGGNERSGGFGGSERHGGFGGSERPGGYGSDRPGGYGNERQSGFGGDRHGGFGSERQSGYGGGDRQGGYGGEAPGGYGSDRRGFSGNRGFGEEKSGYYGERNPSAYESETPMDPASSGRRPKVSRWSDAQPDDNQLPESNPGDMNRPGQQMPKGMGFGGYPGRNLQGGEQVGYDDTNQQSADQYGGRQQRGYSHDNTAISGGYDSQQSGYDASNRNVGYQDYGSSGYQSQTSAQPQESAGGYNYGQDAAASSGYGSYSQPPPQLPQADTSNYQQAYGGNSNNYWQQPPPSTEQQQQQAWPSGGQSTQQSWQQQWQQPPPTSAQPNQPAATSDWSYYQQTPQDWQQQSNYQ